MDGAVGTLQAEISAAAARLVVDEGLEYGAAKRRALKLLGLGGRTALPPNELLDAAVREHIALFCADTQPDELLALRRLALAWMERLHAFRPHLGGAVWSGTATRLSDIHLELFCDDPKSAEIALIDAQVRYQTGTRAGLNGRSVDLLSVQAYCGELGGFVGLHLAIYDHDDLRGALRADAHGRTRRGPLAAARALLAPLGSEATHGR